jgi:hypothetical protein
MRRRTALTLLAVLCLAPAATQAEDRKTKQAEKKLSALLKEFDGELRDYEKELKYFSKAPEAESLLELRKELVEQSAEMNKLEKVGKGSGPAILKLAEEMDATATRLDKETAALERRAKAVAKKTDRAVADRMRGHADSLVKSIEQMIKMFH